MSNTHFRGVLSTPMTPFDEKGRLALHYIDPYLEWQAANGITGIYVLGTWGGFALLDLAERRQVAEVFCASARRHGLHILVHIGTYANEDTFALARHATEHGADAISSVVPQYYSTGGYLGPSDYARYFETLVKNTTAPLYLYNNPRTTNVLLEPNEFVDLAELGVAGCKDGSKNVAWIIKAHELLGRKNLKAQIIPGNTVGLVYGPLYGCPAVTSGAAVVFPRETAEIHKRLDRGDVAGAVAQHCYVLALRSVIGMCSAPPAAAHVLLRGRGPELGQARATWPPISDELLARMERRIADLREAHETQETAA